MTNACYNIKLKVQNRQINFNVTEKFIDMVSDSLLQLTFKKLPLFEFGVVLKNIYNYLKKLLEYFFIF